MKEFLQTINIAEENLSSAILDALGFGVAVINAQSHEIVYVNDKTVEMSGLEDRKNLIGFKCHKLLCPANEGACPISDLGNVVDNSERIMLKSNNRTLPIIKTVIPTTINGVDYFIESLIDNTERKQLIENLNISNKHLSEEMQKTKDAQNKMEFLAFHDYLTGLPNKMLLTKHLEHSIQLAMRTGKLFHSCFWILMSSK